MSDAINMLTLLRENAKKAGSNRGLQDLAAQVGIQEIESLQRENEELKRYVNEAERLFRMYGLSSPPKKGHEWPWENSK